MSKIKYPSKEVGQEPDVPEANNFKLSKNKQFLLDHTKGTRPIVEWFIYLFCLAALFILIAGPLSVFALKSDPSRITLVISIIFIATLVKNFFDVRYIDRQIKIVNDQLSHLQEVKNIVSFLRSSQKSLLHDHINNLFKIFNRDILISQDNLISLLHTRLLSRTRLTDFCSKLLVTLGLIGTIIGLIASAGGLGTVVESVGAEENSPALLIGMQKTINGMGTAFYTTLFGAILGGVGLRLLGNIVDGNVDFLVSRIAEVTEIYILPVLRSGARVKDQREQDLRVKKELEGNNTKNLVVEE